MQEGLAIFVDIPSNLLIIIWRGGGGNWDKNVIESSFMSSDHQRHCIESYVILSDCIFHAIGSYFLLLDRKAFFSDYILHVIGSDVILSDYILHVTGSDVILLDQTSFYRITYFMSLDRTSFYRIYISCHWIGRHVIGSETSFDRASGFLKKVCFPVCFSRYVSTNMAAHVQG